jgi:hypothetical protein
LVLGSMPLQIPFVPFNGLMEVTNDSYQLGWDLPKEFMINTPSMYQELGKKSYTQVGWQLSMPRAIAYIAWKEANESKEIASSLYSKLSKLAENVTNKVILSDNFTNSFNDSLKYGLNNLFKSIIGANITDNKLILRIKLPNIEEKRLEVDVKDVSKKIAQLIPVKLVAISKKGLAGIIAHDKYWDKNGYRAVYFSFEPEASIDNYSKMLLNKAVEWVKNWEYKDITSLIKGMLRVSKELANKFDETINRIKGIEIISKLLICL